MFSALRLSCRPLLLAATVAALAACEASDPENPVYSGTLTDSAIAGISYSTSGGLAGVTDANGQFRFHAGDTVSFTLGGFLLGSVTTSGSESTVTPIELVASAGLDDATEVSNAVTNLLVLLQALDVDGNPDNGISIPDEVRVAMDNAVTAQLLLDLVKAPATFHDTSTALATLHAAADSAAGGTAAIPTPTDALAHFRAQFFEDLEGVYTLESTPGALVFRFLGDGSYLMGQVGQPDGSGQTGVERGQIDWLPASGEIVRVGTPSPDTNLQWGLSTLRTADGSAEEKIYAAFDGGSLVVTSDADPEHPLRLVPVANPANSLLGTWTLNGTGLDSLHFVFFGNGRYSLLDPQGDGECGGPGAEYGSYSLNAGFLSFSNNVFDSNGCGGVHDAGEYYDTPITVNGDGSIRLGTDDGFLYRPDSTLLR